MKRNWRLASESIKTCTKPVKIYRGNRLLEQAIGTSQRAKQSHLANINKYK